MGRSPVRKLKERAAEAARRGDHRRAIALLEKLQAAEPREPAWPRRLADLHRRRGDREAELQALLRAAELYASAGFAVQAIASCKLILTLDPHHRATQERLAELCEQQGLPTPPAARPTAPTPEGDAPLEELLLTEVVSEAVPLPLADEGEGGMSEIPLDAGSLDGELDLELTQSGLHLEVSQPGPSDGEVAEPRTDVELSGLSPALQLAHTPLFGTLPAAALERVIERVRVVDIAEGEILFRQGDPADALYVVVDGAVTPIAEAGSSGGPRTKLAVLEAGEFFGEIGIVTNQPRNATIQALVDTRLLEIRRPAVWQLGQEFPDFFKKLLGFLRLRLVDRLIRTSPLFRAFASAERARVASQFRLLEVRDGSVLVQQQRPAPSLFVLLAGHLDVILMDTDGDKQLARLGPGDVCGERSMLLGEPATASVVASGKCWLLALDADRFARILDRNPKLQQVIERVLASRQAANEMSLRQAIRRGDSELGLV